MSRQGKVIGTSILTMIMVMTGFIIFLLPRSSAEDVQSVLLPPRAHSPHWDHIRILDFGRSLPYITDPHIQELVYEWFTAHVDAAEEHGNAAAMRKRNATMDLFHYHLDLSTCQHQNCGWGNPLEDVSLPEEYFLHFSEDTRLRFTSLDGKELATVSIPECPLEATDQQNMSSPNICMERQSVDLQRAASCFSKLEGR